MGANTSIINKQSCSYYCILTLGLSFLTQYLILSV